MFFGRLSRGTRQFLRRVQDDPFEVSQSASYEERGRLAGSSVTVRRGGIWRNALGRLGRGPDAGVLPHSLRAELEAFAAGAGDVATAAEGVRCHAALDALRRSARSGGDWVEVNSP